MIQIKELKEIKEVRYLVADVESVPDGRLIAMVRYPGENLEPAAAIERYRAEIRENTNGQSDFIPVTFQYPVCVCVAKVRADFSLVDVASLDDPQFRAGEMTRLFWQGIEKIYTDASLVTFNGRGFDVPLMELMAYRYGITVKRHYTDKFGGRFRFGTRHLDLQDVLSNYAAIRMNGGLNLLAKILGKPGKSETKGDEVYDMHCAGLHREISDYCTHDVLDTYFVFLRSRVLTGELTLEREQQIVADTRLQLHDASGAVPAYASYLRNWGDWVPWP